MCAAPPGPADRSPRRQVTMEVPRHTNSTHSGLLAVVITGQLPVRSHHEQLWQLSMATQQSLAAATCQCLGMAALCVAISNLTWITVETNVPQHVQKKSEAWATVYVFGVPTNLHPQQWLNVTHSPEIILLSLDHLIFIDSMMGFCFLGVFSGFSAFFLDFIQIKKLGVARLIIATVLHVLSAILCVLVLVFCSWILAIIQKPSIQNLLKKHNYATSLGESFYLTIAAFILASLASLFSILSLKFYGKDLPTSEHTVEEREIKESSNLSSDSQHRA